MIAIEKSGTNMHDHKAVLAHTLPFMGFMLLMACEPLLPLLNIESKWHHLIRTILALVLLIVYKSQYNELLKRPKISNIILSILFGIFVFLIWIVPYPNSLSSPPDREFSKLILDNHPDFLLYFRFFGSALVVPVIEELFWRSYLTRRLDQVYFEYLEPRYISFFSIVISSVLFSLGHQLWFAGLIAGFIYSLLYRSFQNLWIPIVSHITTNTLLGVWIIQFGHWEYW